MYIVYNVYVGEPDSLGSYSFHSIANGDNSYRNNMCVLLGQGIGASACVCVCVWLKGESKSNAKTRYEWAYNPYCWTFIPRYISCFIRKDLLFFGCEKRGKTRKNENVEIEKKRSCINTHYIYTLQLYVCNNNLLEWN